MTNNQIRARILETADKVVIKRNGEVHAYGVMPNSNVTGWYLVGFRDELAREFEGEAA
ncbi:hypothetical protein [Metarhizobium album]|uniref:hypothetical protein n=1 Tax=Metarhizobium album TaxID=2182425 RepID=UPI001402266A|nr:hypothetical protein [Rhizobium album]